MYPTITKYDVNRLRLGIIQGEIFNQYGTYNTFREDVFPTVTLNTFRQWFKKPYYISDKRLCTMEHALGISEHTLNQRINKEFNLPIDALCRAKGIRLTL